MLGSGHTLWSNNDEDTASTFFSEDVHLLTFNITSLAYGQVYFVLALFNIKHKTHLWSKKSCLFGVTEIYKNV